MLQLVMKLKLKFKQYVYKRSVLPKNRKIPFPLPKLITTSTHYNILRLKKTTLTENV